MDVDWHPGEEKCYDYLNLAAATKEGYVKVDGEYIAVGDDDADPDHPASYTRTYTVNQDRPILVIHSRPHVSGHEDADEYVEWRVNDCYYRLTDQHSTTKTINMFVDLTGVSTFKVTIRAKDCDYFVHPANCLFALGCMEMPTIEKQFCDDDTQLRLAVSNDAFVDYRWYAASNPGVTLSTKYYVKVTPNAGEVYYCELASGMSCGSILISSNDDVTTCDHQEFFDTLTTCFPYEWRGKQILEPGVYHDAEPDECHCDSNRYTIVLKKRERVEVQFDTICRGYFPYYWKGKYLYKAGNYYDTTSTSCETVITQLHLVERTYERDIFDTICTNQIPYIWHGQSLTKSGKYTASVMNPSGCDSLLHLFLQVNKETQKSLTYSICEGEKIRINGKTYDTDGTYNDVLKNSCGCDSILTITIRTIPCDPDHPLNPWLECDTMRSTIDTMVVYDSLPYMWFEEKRSTPGYFVDTILSADGCDSIGTLILRVSYTDSLTVCQNDTAIFNTPWGNVGVHHDSICVDTCLLKLDTLDLVFAHLCVKREECTCDTMRDTTDVTLPYETLKTEGYVWFGQKRDSIGVYRDTILTVDGCDSIGLLILRTTYKDSLKVCGKDTAVFTTPWGEYGLKPDCDCMEGAVVKTADDEDLVWVKLCVTRQFADSIITKDSVCEGNTYTWHTWRDIQITEAGLHYDTAHYTTGCDSVLYTLVLSYNKPTKGDTTAYVCYDDLPYFWHGTIAQDSSTWTTTNFMGCDSVVYLHLIVSSEPQTEHADTTICMGDMIEWHGQTIVTEGTYYDTARVTMGNGQLCDSIWYELAVIIQKSDTTTNNISICTGGEYVWKRNGKPDRVISEAGEYWDTVRYVRTDCDSMIYHLTLQIEDINRDSISDKTCAGIPYLWRGRLLEVAGVYRDTAKAKTETECDTIYTLLLTINQPTSSDTTATACDSFTWHGVIYTESTNEPTWTTTNAVGCDSVVTLHLTIHKSGTGEESRTICDKQLPYTWKGQEYNEAGDYTFDTLTVHGCDSVITLHLHVDTYTTGDTTATACDSFTWHGRTYTESTDTATWTTINAAGCDSVVTLHLTINYATSSEMTIQICDEELPYTWNGKDYTAEGDYTYQTINAAGCDSTATLHLKVIQCCPDTVMQRLELSICDTLMPYTWVTWRDVVIEHTGSYADTLRNDIGCDSIIYTLKLDTFHCCAPLVVNMHIDDICADAPTLPVILNLNSGEIYEYSVHFTNPALNKMPLRDTTVRIETVYASEEPIQWDIPMPFDPNDRRNYPRPDDTYAMDLVVRDVCGDSMVWTNVPFSILYPSWVTDQHWDDVIALLNDRYNGGYTFSAVQWLRNGEVLLGEDNNLYIYLPHELWTNPNHERQDFFYQALLTRTDDGKTIPTCPLIPKHIDNTNVLSDPYISVTPTLVPKENPVVHVMTNTEGTYWVYDPAGKLLQTADYDPCEHSVFDINLYHVQTMYILVFTPRNEKKPLQHKYSVVKVLVE